jgi:peptidoglycan hydrolase CwlO-like protein
VLHVTLSSSVYFELKGGMPACAAHASTLLVFAVQNLEKQLQQVDLELEENAGRVNVMDEHMKNVQQEILYAQHRVRRQLHHFQTQLPGRSFRN